MARLNLRWKRVAVASLVIITAACADEKIASRGYPVMDTSSVSDINEQGATFHGEILDIGDGVADHGFVYSSITITYATSGFTDRISLGPAETKGKFSALANRNLVKGRSYYVRAYAISKVAGTNVMGQEFNFVSQGSAAPEIKDILPPEGTIGDTLIIKGSGFSDATINNLVRIGGQSAPVFKAQADALWVVAPTGMPVGENVVHLDVGQQGADSPVKFNLLKLTITSFEPTTVTFRDTVVVHGTNFPARATMSVVRFMGKDLQAITISRTALKVIVPDDVTPEISVLKMTAGSQVVTATEQIRLFKPVIAALNPLKGTKDTEVTITGDYFNPTAAKNNVLIDTKAAQITSASRKSLKVKVPGGIAPGNYNFMVTTAGPGTVSTIPFQITQPVIQNITPLTGTWGTIVTITGENFGPAVGDNKVTFGTSVATIISTSPAEIKVSVPADLNLKTSNIKVVGPDNREANFVSTFTLDAAAINSFMPLEGKTISVVTITGSNFNPVPANNVVKFGTALAKVVSSTATELSVEVPPTLVDIMSNISVTLTEQTATSANQFKLITPWKKIADFPGTARSSATAFAINGGGYVGLGKESSTVKKFWKYDPTNNQWTEVAAYTAGLTFSSGFGFFGASSFVIGNFAYTGIATFPSSGRGTLRKYDPVANNWTTVKTLGDDIAYAVAFSGDDKGYIATGLASNNLRSARIWEYSTVTDSWTAKADIPTASGYGRDYSAGFTLGSDGYVVGGHGFANDTWQYSMLTNQWTKKANLPAGRAGAVGFSIGGKGYVVGGSDGNSTLLAEVLLYDPASGQWQRIGDFPGGGRYQGVAFVIGDKAYFGTGQGPGSDTKDFWEFDPSKL